MFFPEWPCCERSRDALAPGGHGDDYGVKVKTQCLLQDTG